MAKKHRKLFPFLSESNQTVDCSTGLCDSACPYNCYPYPDYYTPPPPPSLPPPPPPSLSISSVNQENHSNHIPVNVIIIITVASVFSFFLLLSFYLAAKFSSHRRNNINQHQVRSDGGDREEFLEENRVDHPIWLIRTIGLHQSVINSITICRYRRDECLIEGTDCSVCLNEFQEYETLRLLPKCNHAFHISCIDTWLRSHTNCPLCRAHIVPNGIPHDSALTEVSSDNSSTQMEDSDENEERNVDHSENRDEPEREGEDRAFKGPVNSNDDNFLDLSQNTDTQMETSNCSWRCVQNQETNASQSKNMDEFEREGEGRAFKALVNSNDDNSLDLSESRNTQKESLKFLGESDQSRDRNAGQDINRAESPRECEERNFEEVVSSNGDNSLNSRPNTNTQIENFDFFLWSDQNKETISSDQSENSAEAEANADNTILEETSLSDGNDLDD